MTHGGFREFFLNKKKKKNVTMTLTFKKKRFKKRFQKGKEKGKEKLCKDRKRRIR
jgi:hypothetical protein